MRTRGSLLVGLALVASAAAATGSAAASPPTVGWDGTGLRWTSQSVAPGVTVEVGTLDRSTAPYWTVTIDAPATNSLTGQATVAELGTQQWAQDTAARLSAAGHQPQVDAVDWPAFADTPHGVEGYRVRTG